MHQTLLFGFPWNGRIKVSFLLVSVRVGISPWPPVAHFQSSQQCCGAAMPISSTTEWNRLRSHGSSLSHRAPVHLSLMECVRSVGVRGLAPSHPAGLLPGSDCSTDGGAALAEGTGVAPPACSPRHYTAAPPVRPHTARLNYLQPPQLPPRRAARWGTGERVSVGWCVWR